MPVELQALGISVIFSSNGQESEIAVQTSVETRTRVCNESKAVVLKTWDLIIYKYVKHEEFVGLY
jgi:hypothetical protein